MPFDDLLRRRRTVLALAALLILGALPGLVRLRLDNSPQVFFVREAEELAHYRRFRETFGSDATLRLVVSGEGLWTREGLGWLRRLEERAAAVPGIEAAAGLWGRHQVELLDWPPDDPAAFRQQVLGDPLDLGAGWVSSDGRVATVSLRLDEPTAGQPRRALERLEAILGGPPAGVRGEVAGLPVVQAAMDDAFVELATRWFPLLGLVVAVLLIAALRRPTDVARPLIFVGATLVPLFGTLGYLGTRLNLVTVILVPLLFVITLATAVHVQVRYRELRRRLPPVAASRATYRDKGWPVFWTGATSFAAFGSLATSSVPPVRSLGLLSAAGLAWMTLAAFTLLPVLLAQEPEGTAARPSRFELWARRRGAVWAARVVARPRCLLLAASAVAALAVAGLPRLEVGTDLEGYFAPEHPVRRQLEELEDRGLGTVAAELVLVRPPAAGQSFLEPASLARLGELTAAMRREPEVRGAVGAGDLMAAMIRSLIVEGEMDEDLHWLVLGLVGSDPAAHRLLDAFVGPGAKSARVSLGLPLWGYEDIEPVLERLLEVSRRHFPGSEVWITGQFPLLLRAQRTLLRTMAVSLIVTFGVVVALLWLLLGRLRPALLALVPNLWPALLALGAMGWLGVPIDSTTVMIAAVVLGLAVDDTLHTLGGFRQRVGRVGAAEAVRRTLGETAAAHILSAGLLAAGFAVCAASSFVPVARFGALSAGAILAALVGDLLLLPALLGRFAGGSHLEAPPRIGASPGVLPQRVKADDRWDDRWKDRWE